MSISYALYKNHLTSDPDDCMAKVMVRGSAELDDIVDRMTELGTTVTKTDIIAVIEDSLRATESLLLEGFRVNFGDLVQLYPTIKGVFNGMTDSYDKSRHRLDIAANPGTRIRKKVKTEARTEKEETAKPFPVPLEFIDTASESSNESATPGNIGTVNGNRLKFNPQKADEGIFFIHTSDSTEIKAASIQKNKPGQQVFLIPSELTSGESYAVEIRTRFTNDSTLRKGRLEEELTAI